MAPPPPRLMDELIEEILLFFPTDDPASLVRAALVCKSWCRIVSHPRFSCRFRELHNTPTMLGVFVNFVAGNGAGARADHVSSFVPTATSCPSLPNRRAFRTLDARHDRVLLHNKHAPQEFLVVWDPIADEQQVLPDLQLYRQSQAWNAAVLRPSTSPGCHGSGPFLVIFVGITHLAAHLCTYSQDAAAWSEALHLDPLDVRAGDVVGPSILAGDALCFAVGGRVLRYDVAGHALSKIPSSPFMNSSNMCLVTLENGELGAVADANGHNLSLWGYNGLGGWQRLRIINLDTTECRVLGFAEGGDAIFVSAEAGIFAVELKTTRTSKVCEREGRHFSSVVPFLSFYVPGTSLRAKSRENPSMRAERLQ